MFVFIGTLLIEMCSVVPDGIAGFFVSYECLEKYVESWAAMVRDELKLKTFLDH